MLPSRPAEARSRPPGWKATPCVPIPAVCPRRVNRPRAALPPQVVPLPADGGGAGPRRAAARRGRNSWPRARGWPGRAVGREVCFSSSRAWARLSFNAVLAAEHSPGLLLLVAEGLDARVRSPRARVAITLPAVRAATTRRTASVLTPPAPPLWAASWPTWPPRSHGPACRPDRLAVQPAFQVVGQGLGGGVALRGLLSRHLRQMVSRSRRHAGSAAAGGDRLLAEHLQDRVERRRGPERRPAGEQLVEDRPPGRRRRAGGADLLPGRAACSGAM